MNQKNKRLTAYLEKRKNQGTVILCFKILIDNVITNGYHATMTKIEIHKLFDMQHQKFGIGTFRSDYLLRQTSQSDLNAIGVQSDNATFFINSDFLIGLSINDLKDISKEIELHFKGVVDKQIAFLNEISKFLDAPISDRKQFILKMLLEKETEKKGQIFEVTAYAILKAFYKIRGFELNRFSTVYSNDGGIDFTSQTAVYQVTTLLTNRKFEEDLEKAPLKNRIFVYKKSGAGFDNANFEDELVLDYINSEDLIEHLEYLFKKKPEQNSKEIVNTIISEFKREYYI